jgi:hypothetical protein
LGLSSMFERAFILARFFVLSNVDFWAEFIML